MESEPKLGRLIRTIKDRCPLCSSHLQLRGRKTSILFRGENIEQEEEYICCSSCEYESEIKDHKKRKIVLDKTAYIEPVDEKRRYPNNASNNKRSGFAKDNGRISRGSDSKRK